MAGTQEQPGLMPRAINDLFKISKNDDEKNWKFSMTYVEIYNERIKDLLNPGQADLDVRECPKRGNVSRTDRTAARAGGRLPMGRAPSRRAVVGLRAVHVA